MYYNWGYIRNATLAKLDLSAEEADAMNMSDRFVYYANEAIVQISSAVKPKHTFFEFEATEDNIDSLITMPEDFIAFGDDVNYLIYNDKLIDKKVRREANDNDDFEYVGSNQIMFHTIGKYLISYDAIWTFFSNPADKDILEMPADVISCLPSYIASQCMKIDDETMSTILKNEYEVFVARINDTNYKSTKKFRIEGDW